MISQDLVHTCSFAVCLPLPVITYILPVDILTGCFSSMRQISPGRLLCLSHRETCLALLLFLMMLSIYKVLVIICMHLTHPISVSRLQTAVFLSMMHNLLLLWFTEVISMYRVVPLLIISINSTHQT